MNFCLTVGGELHIVIVILPFQLPETKEGKSEEPPAIDRPSSAKEPASGRWGPPVSPGSPASAIAFKLMLAVLFNS